MARKVRNLASLSEEERKHFRNKYDYIFFDMDGTLERVNNVAIPGVPEAVSAIAACGKKIHILTDRCLLSREDIARKIRINFPFIDKGECYTLHELYKVQLDQEVGAVVVCTDFNFSYMKLLKAVNYLVKPEVLFLTSQSYTHVSFSGIPILPAAGALACPIAAITGREPTPFNKGSDASIEYIQSLGYDMKRCLFVGDSLPSDIKCGNKCGMDTLLVLCGHSNEQELQQNIENNNEDYIPTYVTDSTADLRCIYA